MPARAAWWPGVILFIVLVVVGCTSGPSFSARETVVTDRPRLVAICRRLGRAALVIESLNSFCEW
jgi:NAD/NADP transhydrogenase beta subunit